MKLKKKGNTFYCSVELFQQNSGASCQCSFTTVDFLLNLLVFLLLMSGQSVVSGALC